MANDNAFTEDNIRDLTAGWLFEEFWHSKTRPSDDIHVEYILALMNLAGADGVLADDERKWILGNQAAKGTSLKVLNYFRTYQPNPADLEALIKDKPIFIQQTRRPLIFEAFLAASADYAMHLKEREAIYRMGRSMGLDNEILKGIEMAAADEMGHRERVVTLIFPDGLTNAYEIAATDLKKSQT